MVSIYYGRDLNEVLVECFGGIHVEEGRSASCSCCFGLRIWMCMNGPGFGALEVWRVWERLRPESTHAHPLFYRVRMQFYL